VTVLQNWKRLLERGCVSFPTPIAVSSDWKGMRCPQLARQLCGAASASSGSGKTGRATRAEFRYWLEIQTRWSDNDQYGHVNNMVYYGYFDTVINHFLIRHGGLDPTNKSKDAAPIGLCVESGCSYYAPLEYPMVIEAGLMVSKVGTSSLRYEVGIFEKGCESIAAHGHFVHVFVDSLTRKPVPIPEQIASSVRRSLL